VPIFGLLILLLQTDKRHPARILKSAPIAFLGRTSYSIYMVHWLPIVLAAALLKHTFGNKAVDPLWGDLGVAVMVILVVTIAAITYRNIEVPWRSFGRNMALRAHTELATRPI
jgi:peptidoglycan/LPS O-acetylase OafA/YrhL